MTRYGLVIDLSRCIGCNACSVACKAENFTPPGVMWSKVTSSETGSYPNVKLTHQPLQCQHCANAPCVKVCPVGATTKRADGIVLVDYNKCIGCRYCIVACPYGARTFVPSIGLYYPGQGATPYETFVPSGPKMAQPHRAGAVEKCTLCVQRVDQGEDPACVQTCPAHARYFGDLSDPNSMVSNLIAKKGGFQLLPELGTDPSIYYLPDKE